MSQSSRPDFLPHLVLIPSSGMGHLTPFLRLAASLVAHNVHITLITAQPTVSVAESEALSRFSHVFPHITQREIQILPISHTSSALLDDPFTCRYEAIRCSTHSLFPLLSSLSPPASAVITDMSLTSTVVPITKALTIPNYIFFTTSAKMLAVYASYHEIAAQIDQWEEDVITVPGMQPISKSWLPPPLLSQSNSLLKTHFKENSEKFPQSHGILVNTFEKLEKATLTALNNGCVAKQLPLVIPVGPLSPCPFETGEVLTWLNDQPAHSVLYVSFGSRATIIKEQMQELGNGLATSGYKFLWVAKGSKVDREDQEELEKMVGRDVLDKVKQKGLIVKTWTNQEQILNHTAIAGFLSHCGWNSVTEAIWHGIPILAWPQNADQKINADLVETNNIGIWEKSWGWGDKLVVREDIAQKIRELMGSKLLRKQAAQLSKEARGAAGQGGSSRNQIIELIQSLSTQNGSI